MTFECALLFWWVSHGRFGDGHSRLAEQQVEVLQTGSK